MCNRVNILKCIQSDSPVDLTIVTKTQITGFFSLQSRDSTLLHFTLHITSSHSSHQPHTLPQNRCEKYFKGCFHQHNCLASDKMRGKVRKMKKKKGKKKNVTNRMIEEI